MDAIRAQGLTRAGEEFFFATWLQRIGINLWFGFLTPKYCGRSVELAAIRRSVETRWR